MRVYTTESLSLASYLSAKGFPPELAPIQHRPKGVRFRFQATPELEAEVASFEAGTALIEPGLYHFSLVQLRKKITALGR